MDSSETDPYNHADQSVSLMKLSSVMLRGQVMTSLLVEGKERVCLAQISNTLLKAYTYNEIHNRRVALGINCIQCTAAQLELLRESGAMPNSSRRCGIITKKEAERLVKSFLDDNKPPSLPEHFSFRVEHRCAYGCEGSFFPSRYNSSRAKCIQCVECMQFFSPNKFIFHSHETKTEKFNQTASINFNSWRKHIKLINPSSDEELNNAWEDVKSIFNSGKRRRSNNSNKMMNSTFQAESLSSEDESNGNYETLEEIKSDGESVQKILPEANHFKLSAHNYFNPFSYQTGSLSNFNQLNKFLPEFIELYRLYSSHSLGLNMNTNFQEWNRMQCDASTRNKKPFLSIREHFK